MSSSSEVVDSRSFYGQNTPVRSFSQTCNLFSQYLKENNTFPDLTLGRRAPPTATTNRMFQNPVVQNPRVTSAQNLQDQSRTMTIFYKGQIITFDDLAPEKVEEIMKLAEQGASRKTSKPDESSKNIVVSDLPIARKASIARFLEKRKDRIMARSPYQVQDVSKLDSNKTWLGLGAESR